MPSMEWRVRLDPDGAVIVTWAHGDPDDPGGRDAAILDRDGLLAGHLRDELAAIQGGAREVDAGDVSALADELAERLELDGFRSGDGEAPMGIDMLDALASRGLTLVRDMAGKSSAAYQRRVGGAS